MSLIATARALDDARFKWRVRAALLQVAAIHKNSALQVEIDYANHLLRNPMQENPWLEALCATDPGVSSLVTVDEYNAVETEGVEDQTLLYVAEVNFNAMAKQFAGDTNTDIGAGAAQ